jgi:hypothetical protein
MSMARKKALKPRVYTFGQLDTLCHRTHQRTGQFHHRLYGNVSVFPYFPCGNYFAIHHQSKNGIGTIARVFRMSDGDTGYVVFGGGSRKVRRADPKVAAQWTRYAPAFTPIPQGQRLYEGERLGFRVHNGVAMPCELSHKGVASWPTGSWLAAPQCNRPKRDVWALGTKECNAQFPNFIRRAKVFATRLKAALAEGPPCVMQLFEADHEYALMRCRSDGVMLHVCTPPTRTQDGKRLVVHMTMHDASSRTLHHVDGDYAIAHSQFSGIEPGQVWRRAMRWKCAKDAIVGIKEWVMAQLYIPGL